MTKSHSSSKWRTLVLCRSKQKFLEREIEEGSPKLWALRNFYEGPVHLTASQELIPRPVSPNYAPETMLFISRSHFHLIFTSRPPQACRGLNLVGRHKFI